MELEELAGLHSPVGWRVRVVEAPGWELIQHLLQNCRTKKEKHNQSQPLLRKCFYLT